MFLNSNIRRCILSILVGCLIMVACREDEGKFSTDKMPTVVSTSPADGSTDIMVDTYISVTFSKAIDSYIPSTNRDQTGCHGNFQLSRDDFVTCVIMAGQPAADGTGLIYTMKPVGNLDPYETYKLKTIGSSGDNFYTMSSGFSTKPYPTSDKDITSFSFLAADNPALSADVNTTITGTNIIFDVPYGTDITELVAHFSASGESVIVKGGVQSSGVTANNFKYFPRYSITAEDDTTKDYTVIPTSLFECGPLTFALTHLPGDMIFPRNLADDLISTSETGYEIGRTEVTYEQWYEVYTWAASNGYNFANPGREGNDGTDGAPPTSAGQEPVTMINWRDAMVWMNALTGYYNAQNGTSWMAVYRYAAAWIKDSRDSNAIACDNAELIIGAKGFRLIPSDEWTLAARFITDDGDDYLKEIGEYYMGNMASGADNPYDKLLDGVDFDGDNDVEYTKDVAVYLGNSGHKTANVASLSPNALGLYDLSGNVYEWVYYISSSNRGIRGGGYTSLTDLQVGNVFVVDPASERNDFGFRVARTSYFD
jgi:formylglycine-generating enzyme required for sulfatase activity